MVSNSFSTKRPVNRRPLACKTPHIAPPPNCGISVTPKTIHQGDDATLDFFITAKGYPTGYPFTWGLTLTNGSTVPAFGVILNNDPPQQSIWHPTIIGHWTATIAFLRTDGEIACIDSVDLEVIF